MQPQAVKVLALLTETRLNVHEIFLSQQDATQLKDAPKVSFCLGPTT